MQTITREKAVRRPIMEHRWGERVALDLPVRLELAGELLAHGRLGNASISGAWVTTPAKLPVLAAVDVVLSLPGVPEGRLALPAWVVRRETGGLGLEWRDMACDSVVTLLREVDAHAQPWRKDVAFG
jgi:hypothetical protein